MPPRATPVARNAEPVIVYAPVIVVGYSEQVRRPVAMRRFVLFALGVSLVIAAIPSPSLAGVLTPEAVQHAARVQQESLQLVSEIGGTLNTVVVEGHHAYVGAGRRLVVLDAFDPSHPELVFQTDPLGGSVSAIFIQGDKVYATAGNALYVFGISTPLTQPPALVGVYEFIAGDELPYWATDVAVQGDYAYVTFRRGDWLSGGDGLLKVIDVSDPTAPTETGGYYLGSYATSLAVDGDYAYVCTRNGLTVVDVSDPSSPYKRGVSEDVLGGQDVAVSGNYAFVASASGDGFRVLSIVNPDNPQQVGSYKTNWSAYGVEVDTSRAYVSDTQGGLHILSIATVANPTRVGSYDLSDNPDGDHLAAWYLAVAGDTAYVVIDRDSLRVVDISDEENPSKLGSYETPVADPTAVKVVDGTAYVTDYKHGLTILSLANPAAPQVVGVWEKDDPFLWPDDVDVVGNYAYVLGDSALVVVDVSNRAAPLEVGRCSDDGGGSPSRSPAITRT
jgi:hypothetical protein